MRTKIPKPDQIEKRWYLVDAEEQVLGELASKIASILRGKNKTYFSPHLDTGDYVIVINAEKVKLTGNKELQKTYKRYSGFQGGLKITSYERMKEEKPEEIIRHAIKGMLPKNKLGRKIIENLKIYAGENHPHQAQQPEKLAI